MFLFWYIFIYRPLNLGLLETIMLHKADEKKGFDMEAINWTFQKHLLSSDSLIGTGFVKVSIPFDQFSFEFQFEERNVSDLKILISAGKVNLIVIYGSSSFQ